MLGLTSARVLKLSLICVNAYLAQIATTPPQRAATRNEQSKYEKNGKTDLMTRILGWHLPLFWAFLQIFQILELLAILSIPYPSIVPPFMRPFLFPFGHNSVDAIRITPIFVVGTVLNWIGSLIRISCYKTLGRLFTFELSLRDNHKLITHGLYSYIRHPSYLGLYVYLSGLLMCQMGEGSWMYECGLFKTGFGAFLGGAWILLLGNFFVHILFRMGIEDGILRKEFGKEWDAWAERTPYKVLPLIF